MAIQTQVWARDIAKNLFPDNAFFVQGINDDQWVDNKTVNLPQSGAKPTVQRNPSSFPLGGSQRTDGVETYDIDEFATTPTIIRDIEEIETSYQKRQDVLMDHNQELQTKIADWMAYHWSATASGAIVRTSGADRSAHVSGATGNRKKITLDDWLAAKRLMDNMDIPDDGGRFALVPAEMYNDLLEIDKVLSAEYNLSGRLPTGVINQIFNIKIYKRSYATSYSNAATPVLRDPSATALTTANAGIVMWHKNYVRRAKGSVKVFAHMDDPDWLGSKFNAMARAGGRKRYTDGRGVVSIVEAAGA